MEISKSLVPFSPNGWTTALTLGCTVQHRREGFELVYRLASRRLASRTPPLLEEIVPTHSAPHPKRRDELWRTTCFEAFFGIAGSAAYLELNVAPSGDWAWYAFEDYRQGMRAPPISRADEPRIEIMERTDTSLTLRAKVPAGIFAGLPLDSFSATAVLDRAGDLAYWAIAHAGPEADFHLRASFQVGLSPRQYGD